MGIFSSLAPIAPVLGGVAGAALGGAPGAAAGAAIGGGLASYQGGQERNEAQIATAREQMQFQKKQAQAARRYNKRMSNTAHQRSMRDLKRAGLNPILALTRPASSPTSPSPAGAMANIQDEITPAVNTGLQAMKAPSEIDVMQATADNLVADINLKSSQEWLNDANRALTSLSYNEKLEQIKILEETVKLAERDGDINETQAARALEWIKRARESIFGGGGAISPLNRGRR